MLTAPIAEPEFAPLPPAPRAPLWVARATLLWRHRRFLGRVTAISFVAGAILAFVIPKQYKSVARIMPPDQPNSGAMMLAALASRAPGLGSLGTLAGSLLGGHSSTALFVDLLRSGTVSGHLIDRFDLQHIYGNRYRIDTAKHLARCTDIADDKKSGVITIQVRDTSPERARDLAQGYLDELNKLVAQTSTSTARRERIFIEQRLQHVQQDLEQAQLDLSDFSSRSSTVDIKEQTRAMVDVGARVQGQLLVEQSGLQSLRQIYGDGNVRVRESEARIASLQRELADMTGSANLKSSASVTGSGSAADAISDPGELYPRLRQLPRLAVTYADLYRRVKVQETVFELLTQQYELARIEEAKDIPVVSVIDPPAIPEKKSFPPRVILALCLTLLGFSLASAAILVHDRWAGLSADDPGRLLGEDILSALGRRARIFSAKNRGAA